jgi:hypothetical protein
MNRNRAYHRFQRRRAIHHKRMILRDYWRYNDLSFWNPTRIGALDKGKVHCSCWMCRRKSYDDPSISDKRKHDSVNQLIRIYLDDSD